MSDEREVVCPELKRSWPYEAYGVECGEGWKALYQPLIDLCGLYGVPVLQVKEKFGGLRFYVGGVPEGKDIHRLIDAAEAESLRTCEDCGAHGQTYNNATGEYERDVTTEGRWLRTLCKPCRAKQNKEGK